MTLQSKLSSFHKKSALLTQKLWFIMLASSLVGALLFVIIYGVRILDPTYDDWLLQGGDLTQHYVGWLFFRRSEWQFPFGLIDGVLGNIKVSVMYTDSVPLLAVFFKLLSPLLPETFQYYGLLGLGSFMLSGACAALLIHRFSSNGLFCILGSVIYMLCPAVFQRLYGHETLACHYIILLGMILWFYQEHDWGKKWKCRLFPPLLWGALGVLAVGTHIYYLPMTYCFLAGCFITDTFRYKKYVRPLLCLAAITVTSLLTMWLLGAFYTKADISADGLGQYSANLNTFWNPLNIGGNSMQGYSSEGSFFLSQRPVNSGQYEGYAYVEFGVMVGAVIALIAVVCRAVKLKKECVSRFRSRGLWLAAGAFVFGAALFYSLSPQAYFNETRLYEISWSENVRAVMSSFRATGRFAWVCDYMIFTAVMYGLSHIRKKHIMIAALAFCTALQVIDLSGLISSRKWYKEEQVYTSPLQDPRWEQLAQGKSRFVGLSYDQSPPTIYAFSIFAYRHNMTINHFHIARPPFDEILAQYYDTMSKLESGNADMNALYVFMSKDYIPQVEGMQVYEMDGYYVVDFPNKFQ